jgi:hypothetical protein
MPLPLSFKFGRSGRGSPDNRMSSYLGWLVGALTSVPGNVGECTGSLATCDSLRNDGARLQVDGPSGVGIGFAPDNITGSLRVDTLRRGAEASGVGSNCSGERLPRVPLVPRPVDQAKCSDNRRPTVAPGSAVAAESV